MAKLKGFIHYNYYIYDVDLLCQAHVCLCKPTFDSTFYKCLPQRTSLFSPN